MQKFSIAIHGGAGTILRSAMTSEKEEIYKNALKEAIVAGSEILSNGGKALDAVEAAVRKMEDHPFFNAGRGSVFTSDGKNEMDAAIMDGCNLKAGAVACVRNIKNPVTLARMVMEKSDHVLLTSQGAFDFGQTFNIETESDAYFFEDFRYDQLRLAQKLDKSILDHMDDHEKKFGTVGAVAFDCEGNLAAATSTGGMTNKKFGRVGDSPLIGIGNYANNNTCAVSCTGHGEFFIRSVVAYDVSCLMEYKGLSLREACEIVVNDKLLKLGGEGGLIATDRHGNIEMTFNCEGMYRARQYHNSDIELGFYKEMIS